MYLFVLLEPPIIRSPVLSDDYSTIKNKKHALTNGITGAKLSPSQVLEIRDSSLTALVLSQTYNITRGSVYRIRKTNYNKRLFGSPRHSSLEVFLKTFL